MIHSLQLPFPRGFHFEHTVYSHGWCALLPYRLDRTALQLRYPVQLSTTRIAELRIGPPRQSRPAVTVEVKGRLSEDHRAQLTRIASAMLHLDLDLQPFYRMIREDSRFSWMAQNRAGRMLRAPSFFEDAVKMLLTTNCSWSLTETMTSRLCETFGTVSPFGGHCFPVPEAIADSSEDVLRREVKLGYRAPYLLEMVRRIVRGDLSIEDFRGSSLTAAELYRELRGIKGIGDYAAGNLIKLLGRFDYLGIDSWCRAKYAEMYHNGNPVPDSEIVNFYAPFNEWRGLVMWLDVTRHWYGEKFPF